MVFISDSSGRFQTDYRANCLVNEQIKQSAGIKDNYNYRLYLQRNALTLMDKDRKSLKATTTEGCGKCKNCLLSNL